MKYFIYENQSSEDILDAKLFICEFDEVTELPYSEVETIKGETNSYRDMPNCYGKKHSGALLPTIVFVKEDKSEFSYEDREIIESWLTSASLPKPLTIVGEDEEEFIYNGVFLSPIWNVRGGKILSCTIQFECSSPYYYINKIYKYDVSGSQTVKIKNESSEKESYVYPRLKITKSGSTGEISIKNVSDNNNVMTLRAYGGIPISIDCDNCIIKDAAENGVVSFDDLGWNDVGNIYWLRLPHGENTITFTGSMQIEIECRYPKKGVAGWYD